MIKPKDNSITMRSSPNSIIKRFSRTFEGGGSINLDFGNGDFLFATGSQPETILCKLQNGRHYSYQRDRNMWVKL